MRVIKSIEGDMRRRAAKVLRAVDILWTHRRLRVDSDANVEMLRDEMLRAMRRMARLTRLHTRKEVAYLAHEVENVRLGLSPREGLLGEVVKVLKWASAFAEKEK